MKASLIKRGISMIAVVAAVALSVPAFAQYMYLDVDGDGVNTAADVLTGTSTVPVHIYLRTNANRIGNPTACVTADGDLDLRSTFEFVLRASGGTVQWGNFKPTIDGSLAFAPFDQNASDVYVYYKISAVYPPGIYELGYLDVTPVSGSPILDLASSTPLSGAYSTAFGASCYGLGFDNTMKLGREWSDADGTYGPAGGTISGLIFDDANGTSTGTCTPDVGEVPLKGWFVSLSPTGQTAVTNDTGIYTFPNLAPGTYSVAIAPTATWNQTCPPGNATQTVMLGAGQSVAGIDFGVKKWPQATVDLVASLTGACKNAPGTNTSLWVDCVNLGPDCPNVTLTVTLPSELVYLSSTPLGVFDALLNTVTFALGTVHSHEPFHFRVDMAVPATAPDIYVTEAARLEPIVGDAFPDDNVTSVHVPLNDSWDPNMIVVDPQGRILRSQLLTYHAGFQNTGTAPAANVVVKIDLDANLNFPSLGIGAASHPFSFSVSGRQLIWTFNNINLPYSTADEPGSHGYFKFTALPLSSAPDGASIQAMANIYFDFNDPVQTNTVTDVIDSPPLLEPVPNRSMVEGGTIDQPLHGSDPEGDALTFTLASGPPWSSVVTTGTHSGNLHLAPQAGDAGAATLTIEASDGLLSTTRNSSVNVLAVTGIAEAETFAPQEIHLNSGWSRTSVRLVPTNGNYRVADLGLSTLVLRSPVGDRSIVASAIGGPTELVSADGSVSFPTSDLRALFSDLRRTATVTLLCEAQLAGGRTLSGTIPFTVHVADGRLAASVSPNPFNPRTTLTFRTIQPGFASVQLFDPSGRKVRTLLSRAHLSGGYHEVIIDGLDDTERTLGSGIYFFRVDTHEGSQVGRVTLLR